MNAAARHAPDERPDDDRARWDAVERAFVAALETPPDARDTFVARCSNDPAIRDEVQRVLLRHASLERDADSGTAAGAFLERIDHARAARLLEEEGDAPRRIGRYEVERRLGRGAFGAVYLARDPELEREVAIKLLAGHLGGDATWVERFREEARAASRLAHPHIVAVHDVGCTDDDRLFIVMSYEEGGRCATS